MATIEDRICGCLPRVLGSDWNPKSNDCPDEPFDSAQATVPEDFLAPGVRPDVSGLLGCDLDGIQLGELANRHICAPDQ